MPNTLLALSRLAAPSESVHGTRLADARQALDQSSRHAAQLPWHRRSARREARRTIATARAQLLGAHLERWGLVTLDRRVTPFLDTRGRSAGGHARSLALTYARRTPILRRILFAAAAFTAASIAAVALIAALATHVITL